MASLTPLSNHLFSFLDTLTIAHPDGSITTTVYRKPTHTDQYLNFNSNHPLEHKRGVVHTLMHRAEVIVKEEEELRKEKDHIRGALRMNNYPEWLLQADPRRKTNPERDRGKEDNKRKKIGSVIIPYVKGVSETLRRIFGRHNIQTHFKPTNTLRQLLVKPKDSLGKDKIVGPVYQINCESCEASYIGETERSLKARFAEHRRPSTTTSEVSRHIHTDCPNHNISLEETRILCVENRWFERGVKEAIYIRMHEPTLNRDGGRYQLPPVWTNTLKVQASRPGHQGGPPVPP